MSEGIHTSDLIPGCPPSRKPAIKSPRSVRIKAARNSLVQRSQHLCHGSKITSSQAPRASTIPAFSSARRDHFASTQSASSQKPCGVSPQSKTAWPKSSAVGDDAKGGKHDPYEVPPDNDQNQNQASGPKPRSNVSERTDVGPNAPLALTKRSKNAGSLTVTPSNRMDRISDFKSQIRKTHEDQKAQAKRAAEQQIALEKSEKEARARAKANRPEIAIDFIKKMTEHKRSRQDPGRPAPTSSFFEPEYPDGDLDEVITCTQLSIDEYGDCGESSLQPSSKRVVARRFTAASKAASPVNSWKPVNTLWPVQNSQPEFPETKIFGDAYPAYVRKAFADSESIPGSGSDTDETKKDSLVSLVKGADDDSWMHDLVGDRDAGIPEEYRDWEQNYETCFTVVVRHNGPLWVADGPWKGLILNEPCQGLYMPGFAPPTEELIAEMKNLAQPNNLREKHRWLEEESNSSDSAESVKYEESGDDSDPEDLSAPHQRQTPPSRTSGLYTFLVDEQLLQEAPPSNQELGVLMSSSPSKQAAEPEMPGAQRHDAKPESSGGDVISVSSSEPSSGIPATPSNMRKLNESDAELDVTPNFRQALSQIETPITRSSCSQQSSIVATKDEMNSTRQKKDLRLAGTSSLVVKILQMSTGKQAQYKKSRHTVDGETDLHLKSFEEINRDQQDAGHTSQDSGAAAVEDVLKESPTWLTSIPEVGSQSSNEPTKRGPHAVRSWAGNTPTKTGRTTSNQKRKQGADTNEGDPAYLPHGVEGQSDGSGHSDSHQPNKSAKKHVKATPRSSAHQKKASDSAACSEPQQDVVPATSVRKAKLTANEPNPVSSTPVPAPSISELMQKIRGIPIAAETPTPPELDVKSQTTAPNSRVQTPILPRNIPTSAASNSVAPPPTKQMRNRVVPGHQNPKRKHLEQAEEPDESRRQNPKTRHDKNSKKCSDRKDSELNIVSLPRLTVADPALQFSKDRKKNTKRQHKRRKNRRIKRSAHGNTKL
ncbi:hypothetical protein BJ170DRAFT_710075 [Xylariales sp. AK1849]|nr:hypothetical protein BJ170DRAFT_710075 [Xylariales sp. AK1849]